MSEAPVANGHRWPCAGFYTGNHEPMRAGAWECFCCLPLAREVATALRGDTPEHQARLREIDPAWEPFTERDLDYVRAFLASDWLDAHDAALLASRDARLAAVRAEGVNDGLRLAAQLVTDHALGPIVTPSNVAEFLIARADRAALHSDPSESTSVERGQS